MTTQATTKPTMSPMTMTDMKRPPLRAPKSAARALRSAAKSAGALVTEQSTDTPDWTESDRMLWYVRANAESLEDGTMDVLAVEGVDDTFDVYGELAPVYTFSRQ